MNLGHSQKQPEATTKLEPTRPRLMEMSRFPLESQILK